MGTLRRLSGRKSYVTGNLEARGVVLKRQLSDGGIAGIVVGVIVGIALVALCSYPFIIRRIRRRKQGPPHGLPGTDDLGAGEVPATGDPGIDDHQRRLSSQDSFKPSGENTRGGVDGSVKDLDWNTHDGLLQQSNGQGQPDDVPRIDTNLPSYGFGHTQPVFNDSIPRSAPFGSDENYQEYMPQSIGDAPRAVLNGTNADYYSPSVPSEAFGMFSTEEPRPQPERSWSRGSSLKYNLKQMFSRKSTRDQSLNSPTWQSLTEAPGSVPRAQDGNLQRITTGGGPTESPTDMTAPAADSLPVPSSTQALGSPIALPSTLPKGAVQTSPDSPPTTFNFNASQSPPSHPAPGTVNPMDIMPASTETEVWHRTDYQLYVSQSSPNQPPPSTGQGTHEGPVDSPSPLSLPPNDHHPQPVPVVQSPTPTQSQIALKMEEFDDNRDIPLSEIPTNNHLSPLPDSNVRHQSHPSDVSTPQPGPAFTNPSSLSTPATQLDTPSPHSGTSSDFRHSVSPGNAASNSSPGNGLHACDEPGCNQVFDQPHKLKHHQRYHTKDHKCPYPNCGKGFGTKTHLQRHVNDRHERKKKFHCAVQGCDYSRQGGKGFPRKDNWKRHMTKIHNMDQRHLPEPVEVDQEMSGT
ncbi:zinc finger transcription factor ace1 [Fusarium beomiforme]|uniref:Zinc finger transcription factor ace1 n=1 Tax=Fusarium beomiforme TaxID=44412 RepID=A0A9P5DZC4_9HYPO|nr:zinc finger transcription factor ace1 [Fusarium beomiforme]